MRARYASQVAPAALDQHLAFGLFDIAVFWELKPRIVRMTFLEVWQGNCTAYLRVSAAAQFWSWAARLSPHDLKRAEKAGLEAWTICEAIPDALKRDNLKRMLKALSPSRAE